jgi:DNA repair protein RecN (Recombination protein N)
LLREIHIKNYALIDQLDLQLDHGLTMITGETGAGKSILLGALGLVTGKRADISAVRDGSKKCVVEAHFDLEDLGLEELFITLDVDYDQHSILRREILPSGKSRAFVNDMPTTLAIMSKLGNQLIDIHSQHQTLQLATDQFQIDVLNAYVAEQTAGDAISSSQVLDQFKSNLQEYKKLVNQLSILQSSRADLLKESDYNTFMLNELEDAQLDSLNQEELEQENEQLANVEIITEALALLEHKMSADEQGVIESLREALQHIKSITGFSKKYEELATRLQSTIIEIEDIVQENEVLQEQVEQDPERLQAVNERLKTLDMLYRKHQVDSVDELLQIREHLADQVLSSQSIDGKIEKLQKAITSSKSTLKADGLRLHEMRRKHAPQLEQAVLQTVKELGMPDAQFKVQIEQQDEFLSHGMDLVQFTFTANRGSSLLPLDKAASGGELSRLMLAIKALLSQCKKLPTILFDEIDTGVSGAIADKMATIMRNMSQFMQVITITHLPQIAAAGSDHIVVRKKVKDDRTVSTIEKLNQGARIEEIAQMLSGGTISDAARENARILLQ